MVILKANGQSVVVFSFIYSYLRITNAQISMIIRWHRFSEKLSVLEKVFGLLETSGKFSEGIKLSIITLQQLKRY